MHDPALLTLDPAGLERMQNSFLHRMQDFGDFTDGEGRYWTEERAYKEELCRAARRVLVPELFSREMRSQEAERALEAVLRVLTIRLKSTNAPQNIVGWRYFDFLRHLSESERVAIASAFSDLFFGTDEAPYRVERFVRVAWPAMRQTSGGKPYAATRMVPTFFLMLLNPGGDIAVRTDLFSRAGRMLLRQQLLHDHPFDAPAYRGVLAFAEAIRRELNAWGWCPRDLIDVHSFLWIATRNNEEFAAAQHRSAGEN